MDIQPELRTAARQRRLIPFIGAGFSSSLGLPTWSELMDKLAETLGMDPEVARLHGDFPQMAEYLHIRQKGIGKLRSSLDRIFNSDSIDVAHSQRHMLLPQLHAPAIYTTNWDNLIERGFDLAGLDYNKIITVDDMVNAFPRRPNIIKYHGDFSDDSSLVFTESSYYTRLDLESPLDVRFRSDILGRTLLFLGYSFTDVNIRFLWFKLTRILDQQLGTRQNFPYAFVLLFRPNPVLRSCVFTFPEYWSDHRRSS